ncbi:hypothetical protein [Chryseobacterium sp. KBW03]|uniref:hypothetical protein n=1 Tax=Chryseobacterium sp. KBW03 TaxID=2153362 RepID=UPI000F5AB457|nr:hypothetical protein [Chryseobacterium sp. KBW03]
MAIFFSVGSAFTRGNKTVAGEYVFNGSIFYLKGDGICIAETSTVCDYTKIGNATTTLYPNPNQNPANFTPYRVNSKYEE